MKYHVLPIVLLFVAATYGGYIIAHGGKVFDAHAMYCIFIDVVVWSIHC